MTFLVAEVYGEKDSGLEEATGEVLWEGSLHRGLVRRDGQLSWRIGRAGPWGTVASAGVRRVSVLPYTVLWGSCPADSLTFRTGGKSGWAGF